MNPLDEDKNNYYKTNFFLKFLRFFNLLEPDRNILSISKIFMWVMLGITLAVFFYMPENLEAILGASGALITTFINYGYRRWIQHSNIINNRNDKAEDDSGSGPSWFPRRNPPEYSVDQRTPGD